MIRLLIVAAYASVRAGLHALLADAADIRIIGDASGGAELERLLPESAPDVVLYDAGARDGGRVPEAVAGSAAGLVVLDEGLDGWQELAARPLRGWAVLGKEAEGEEIAAAARAVAAGLVALDRGMAQMALAAPATAEGRAPMDALPGAELTTRERQVLQLMALGLPNKTIAARLGISLHTVKFHVASILAKLGAASRTEAVTLGARRGDVIL